MVLQNLEKRGNYFSCEFVHSTMSLFMIHDLGMSSNDERDNRISSTLDIMCFNF